MKFLQKHQLHSAGSDKIVICYLGLSQWKAATWPQWHDHDFINHHHAIKQWHSCLTRLAIVTQSPQLNTLSRFISLCAAAKTFICSHKHHHCVFNWMISDSFWPKFDSVPRRKNTQPHHYVVGISEPSKVNYVKEPTTHIRSKTNRLSVRSALFPTSMIRTSAPRSVRTSSIQWVVCWNELRSAQHRTNPPSDYSSTSISSHQHQQCAVTHLLTIRLL